VTQAGTFLPATVSLSAMKKRGLFVAGLMGLSVLAACAFLRSYKAVGLLTRNGSAMIEVNGGLVGGEILIGGQTAIVTRRDAGKVHSYRLFFEGDTDSNEDTSFVIDCHAWVAPRLPFLLEAANYPPCNVLSDDVYKDRRWPLHRRAQFIEFLTNDGSTIRIGNRNK
jgi:hypothetical protein